MDFNKGNALAAQSATANQWNDSAPTPNSETVTAIVQESIKYAHDLNLLLGNIGDSISGPIAEVEGKNAPSPPATLRSSLQDLRRLIQRAYEQANRIGTAL